MARLGPANSLLHRPLEQLLHEKFILVNNLIVYCAELSMRTVSFDMEPAHAYRHAHIQLEVRSRRVHGDYTEPVSVDMSGLLKTWVSN